jgi:hypothetical protein
MNQMLEHELTADLGAELESWVLLKTNLHQTAQWSLAWPSSSTILQSLRAQSISGTRLGEAKM